MAQGPKPTAGPKLKNLSLRPSLTTRFQNHLIWWWCSLVGRLSYLITNWVLSTNHRRIASMYFVFVGATGFAGLVLATLIRIELAYPGQVIMGNNAERYLTVAALHGIVMVFFVVIPVLFGAFGNFLLPTQLGVRDVAFPRLNSFMFWVTPGGFILLLHIFFFDRSSTSVFPVNHVSLTRALHRKHFPAVPAPVEAHMGSGASAAALRAAHPTLLVQPRGSLFARFGLSSVERHATPALSGLRGVGVDTTPQTTHEGAPFHTPALGLATPTHPLPLPQADSWMLGTAPRSTLLGPELTAAAGRLETEREMVRQMTALAGGRAQWVGLSGRFSEGLVTVKVSSWAANKLIPGWAFVTPYSSRLRYSALGKVDIALVVIFMAGLGSVFSAVNYVITYRCVGAPAMRGRRELRSFFADALLVGSRMMLLANPALLVAILLLLSDRHLGTSVFDFSGGGDTIMFQHLFWFFGHPEVYIIIIPCFGFANSLMPHFLRKRLSGRLSLQFSTYTIAFMSFAVWGHHMYMVGLANTTRTLYSTMTVMISVPASTKVLHWCVTFANSAPLVDVSFCFLLAFNYFFVLGGLSGMFLAHIGFDVLFHDTFYVIGHFHVMLAGAAVSCIFSAFYFYFAAIVGVRYSRPFAYLHFACYFVGQLVTLVPMFWLGYSGMPRRIMDYPAYYGGWHSISSAGHLLSVLGFVFFLLMLLDSLYEGRSPSNKNLGVSRLNTRLAFYGYERRKLAAWAQRGMWLGATNVAHPSVHEVMASGELEVGEYVLAELRCFGEMYMPRIWAFGAKHDSPSAPLRAYEAGARKAS